MYSSGRRPEFIFENLSGIRICRHFYPVEVGLASSGIRKRREITRLLNLLISKLLISLILSKFFIFLSSGFQFLSINVITGLSAFLVNFGHWCPVKFGEPCMPHICSLIYIHTYSYRSKGRNWRGGKWPIVQRDAPPSHSIYI